MASPSFVGFIAAAILVAAFSAGCSDEDSVTGPAGEGSRRYGYTIEDTVGQETGETAAEYKARTPFTISGDTEDHWALVTFAEPLSLAAAAEWADRFMPRRVNELVTPQHAPITVPEPGPRATWTELFTRYGEWNGIDTVTGLVVRDREHCLQAMYEDPSTFHVEVLPADATWGFISVRPVSLD